MSSSSISGYQTCSSFSFPFIMLARTTPRMGKRRVNSSKNTRIAYFRLPLSGCMIDRDRLTGWIEQRVGSTRPLHPPHLRLLGHTNLAGKARPARTDWLSLCLSGPLSFLREDNGGISAFFSTCVASSSRRGLSLLQDVVL